MSRDLHMPPPVELRSTTNLEEENPEIKEKNCNQSPSTVTTIASSSLNVFAGKLPDINTSELMDSYLLECTDSMLSSYVDDGINVCINDYGDPYGAALQLPFNENSIYIQESSSQPVALPNAAEMVDSDATNNRAHQSSVPVFHSEKKALDENSGVAIATAPNLVGQEKSSSTASNSNKKRQRETAAGEGKISGINEQVLRQNFGRPRKEVARDLDVSLSTFKRRCRDCGIPRWQNRVRSSGERNTCQKFKASTHGQTETVAHLHKPNEVSQDFFDGLEHLNTESSIAGLSRTPTSHDDSAGTDLDVGLPFSYLLEESEARGLSEGAFQQKDQITVSSAYPNCHDRENTEPQIASKETVTGSSNLTSQVEAHSGGYGSGSSYWSQPESTITVTGPIPRQDMTMIKVTYGDTNIKFKLPFTSRLAELNQEVAMRLNLKIGSFKVEYKDEEGDCIWIPCDKDLRDHLQLFISLGNPVVKLLVRDKVGNAKESSGSFKRTRP